MPTIEKTKRSLKKKVKDVQAKAGFPAHKFLGKVKFAGDGLEIQRKLRDEWEERLRRH
jgi:hypothetical protein